VNSNENISALARQERLTYFKNWRENNKDKVKQHNQNYWKKRVERKLSQSDNNI